jgi:hypothetical protein
MIGRRYLFILAFAAGVAAAALAGRRGAGQAPPGDAAGIAVDDISARPEMPETPAVHGMDGMAGMGGAGGPGGEGMGGMGGAGTGRPGAGMGDAGMGGPGGGSMPGMDHADASGSMAHEHMAMGPHMRMSAPRPRSVADQSRADAIVRTLRAAVARYRDYRVAVADGYVQYLPNLPQPMYHFTNWGNAYLAEFGFDPARPTSLLYKPVAGGFELVGAMYTAPRRFGEDQLDERVPLSVASWHQHVNICLPQGTRAAAADWRKFGFGGSILTAGDCEANGGTFHPVIFGWMVHVHPFEPDPAKIWAH